ncbi:MAG: hypothetical protein PHF60_03210, partial [Candidatus ainarchaeum sp.]|nr:hypothetical protein [Candidatus ainarchaeum sp.]
MAGSRVSLVLHDGNRITDRKPLAKAFHDKTAMEITRAMYGPAVETKSYDKLGEEVVAIGDLRKDDKTQTGFQLYLAIEVDGKVVEMGLPFVSGSNGEDFLNPANIKPGDIDSLLKNMPSNTEILLVWRLDRGMTQDIVLSEDSVVSSMVPPKEGNDFSLLDQKPCVGCGMGVGSKIDLIADISEVKIFCGDLANPIRMATILVPPPESFLLDSWVPQTPLPLPLVQIQQRADLQPNTARNPNHLAMHVDFMVRMSWEDSLKASEIGPPLLLQSGFCPEGALGRQDQPPITTKEAPKTAAALVFAICSSKPVCQAEIPVVPASPKNNLMTLIMNPAEFRLWNEIHKRPVQDAPAQQYPNPLSAPMIAAPIPKTTNHQFFVPIRSQPIANKIACEPHEPQQETIVKTIPIVLPAAKIQTRPKKRQKPQPIAPMKKKKAQPQINAPEKPKPSAGRKPRRKAPKPFMATTPEAKQKKIRQKTPKAFAEHTNKKAKQEAKSLASTKTKTSKAKTRTIHPHARPKPTPAFSVASKKSRNSAAKKKGIQPYFLNDLLGVYRKSKGRKFRM